MFAAIADPTRRRLIGRLCAGEHSVQELTDGAGMTLAAVSLHLQILHAAGLVSRRAAGRRRLYRLEAGRLQDVVDWLGGLRAFWDDRLDRLEAIVDEVNAERSRSDQPED